MAHDLPSRCSYSAPLPSMAMFFHSFLNLRLSSPTIMPYSTHTRTTSAHAPCRGPAPRHRTSSLMALFRFSQTSALPQCQRPPPLPSRHHRSLQVPDTLAIPAWRQRLHLNPSQRPDLPHRGTQGNDSESLCGESSYGSWRSKYGVSPDRNSCISTSSKSLCYSKRTLKGLNNNLRTLLDLELFSTSIGDWVLERTSYHSTRKKHLFKPPFIIDELRKLDYALEGVLFQQLFRMPHSHYDSDDTRERQFLALEDFLHTAIVGLWHTFWSKTVPAPFSVSCPRRPGSKFYTIEKAILNGRLQKLSGAAVVANSETDLRVQWDHVLEFALFKPDAAHGSDGSFSASTICEALFYGFHILVSRSLNKIRMTNSDSVYLLILDSKFGGVLKLRGDLNKLDINASNPYSSIGEWIKLHAEIHVSPIDRIWNKFGNACWGDVGALQLLLATFNSIVDWKGPPQRSIDSLAADHSLRLQKRMIECNRLLPIAHINHVEQTEIVELGHETELEQSLKGQIPSSKLKPGEVVLLDDHHWKKGFQIKEILPDGTYSSFSAISLDHPSKLLTLYVGSHSSKLEPSWEAMSLWYLVQRQTKVLNIMKQRGILSKHLPEIIASGRVLHQGLCRKHGPGDCCDHPLCGTPILVTFPVGQTVSYTIAQDGPFSSEDALRCCRDSLIALKFAAMAKIQHGDICPESIVRVDAYGAAGSESVYYVIVSWGHAVMEDRDSPAMNLQFSSSHALQYRKLCPSSDVESLVYLLYFLCGGMMQQNDSIESALVWRETCWAKRLIQKQLGEVSALLKAFADYVDGLCGTPYAVDYDFWLAKLNRAVNCFDRGKTVERLEVSLRLDDMAESSGTSAGEASIHW